MANRFDEDEALGRPRARRTLRRQGPPPGIYASSYDPLRAAAICRRVAAGESLRAICRADPTMPTEKTVWNWARAHPEFAQMKAHALAVARAASLARQAERDEERRERVAATAAAARRRGRGRYAWNAGVDTYDEAVAEAILIGLAGGASLKAVCARRGMPCVGTVYNWLRAYPDFLAQYRQVKVDPAEPLVTIAAETTPWMGRERNSEAELRRRVRAAEKAGARLTLKRYAPYRGPRGVCWTLEDEATGALTILYGGADDDAPRGSERRRVRGALGQEVRAPRVAFSTGAG